MTNQPEKSNAERIASFLERMEPMFPNPQAAAELRRLHELNRELVDSLGEVVAYCEEHGFSWSVLAQAKTTLNKATGESNE